MLAQLGFCYFSLSHSFQFVLLFFLVFYVSLYLFKHKQRSAAFPALKQLKLSKFLTVLLSCGAIRTGSEDTTDFVSAIFRGVNWLLLTSRFSVTMFYSGFAVNLVLTHSSFTQNLLSFYPRGFSTSIFYAVLSYCNARRARIISSSKCSPIV